MIILKFRFIILTMKRALIIIVVLLFTGMAVFAQDTDMSFYFEEYNRTGTSVFDLLDILVAVKNDNLTGIGDFYHNAIVVFLQRLPNFATAPETVAIQEVSRLILRGLGAEKHTESAPYVWTLVEYYDVSQQHNDGFLMHEALVTMGQIGAVEYAPHIVTRMDYFSTHETPDIQTRRKLQLGLTGAISALEALHEPIGVKPVFFASIGWYDPDIRAIAAAAFPNIMEDPCDIVIELIQNPFNGPSVKLAAWRAMTGTRAPNSSKAKVAVVTVEMSYTYIANNREGQSILREMRMSAVDYFRTIREINDDAVYAFLERAYREGFYTNNYDTEIMMLVVKTLTAVATDRAVDILTSFLRELHTRRRSGPWGIAERQLMQYIIPSIGTTGTQSPVAIQLLSTIQSSSMYTGAEQNWARNALRALAR